MSTPPNVLDVTIQNFEESVIRGSLERPVLVFFCARWSDPCKQFGPVLGKVTEELGGALLLGLVDIDKVPEIAQAFRVQNVPTAVLLVDGKPVDAFTGEKTEDELRQFLSAHVFPTNAGNPLEAAKEMAAAGHLAEAAEMLTAWLEETPADGAARTALGIILLEGGDPAAARAQHDLLSEDDLASPEARSLCARLDLIEGAGDLEALGASLEKNPKDVGARIEYGKALVANGKTEEGLEELLEAAMRDMGFEDGAPRKALIEVFLALGSQDPLTLEFQQRLSVLLCS